jgi:hypothetical protein
MSLPENPALPVPSFPDELPVSARREEIAATLTAAQTSMSRHNITPNICHIRNIPH